MLSVQNKNESKRRQLIIKGENVKFKLQSLLKHMHTPRWCIHDLDLISLIIAWTAQKTLCAQSGLHHMHAYGNIIKTALIMAH